MLSVNTAHYSVRSFSSLSPSLSAPHHTVYCIVTLAQNRHVTIHYWRRLIFDPAQVAVAVQIGGSSLFLYRTFFSQTCMLVVYPSLNDGVDIGHACMHVDSSSGYTHKTRRM